MKHLLALYFFMSIFVLTISAQITEEEIDDLLNDQQIKVENPIIKDFVSMSQISNDIASMNYNLGLSVEINQNGDGNIGYIKQIGSGLKSSLSQYGSFNETNIWSKGENIHICKTGRRR